MTEESHLRVTFIIIRCYNVIYCIVIVTVLVVVLLEIRPQWIVQAGLDLPVLQSQTPNAKMAGVLHAGSLTYSYLLLLAPYGT